MRCEFRQGVLQRDLWARRSISNPVPGVSISMVAPWHDVFACTLLHRELRDYSLGQIAFAVFQALFAITQLLCHVSALLTSACKQA